ncbi:hypothetical protein [Aminobacter sp. AP02]|uniref:hypothetical protein n=1 Tax=Aminobacter sp. AP02 TaxID=2135737 RepID=UPI000D6AB51E|nr:hypothetical protein [Aminobacter sp. AP02]PWK76175.1 hypothetical protein C8K44_102162 [Aminobacter sp. AP02]
MRIQALITAVAMLSATTAHAACPVELAVYGDRDKVAEIDFRPTLESATVTNSFKMVLDNDVVLDGVVMWSQDVARPNGMLMHQCPEGDVTGEEIEACTVWQGVIYSVDDEGNVGLLPRERTASAAPRKLIFSDLGHALRTSAAYGPDGFSKVPWDVFEIKGCQE